MIKLSSLQVNPQNPRTISEAKFSKLVASIKETPKFMEVRPLVVRDGVVFGGNMRLKALIHLNYKEIPDEWVKDVSTWSLDEIRKFVVTDNMSYGDNDWDMLGNLYDKSELEAWGFEPYELGDFGDSKSNGSGEGSGSGNTEVNLNDIDDELNCECPKCKFRFKYEPKT